MPHSRSSRPDVRALLRATWDDSTGLGEVVVIHEVAGDQAEIFARTCDAWCYPLHVHKGAERLLEVLLSPMAAGYVDELPFDD